MAANLLIAEEAEQDMDDAYAWYERQRAGLGEEFLSCVNASINAICRSPEMHAAVYKNYRRKLIRRFPYAIFYEFDNGTVTVYAVCHTSRDPAKWRSRLP